MDKRLIEYMAELDDELRELIPDDEIVDEKEKREFLFTEEFVDKVYSPDGVKSVEYPFAEYDAKNEKYLYYAKKPWDISDGDYLQIKNTHKNINDLSKCSRAIELINLSIIINVIVLIMSCVSTIISFINIPRVGDMAEQLEAFLKEEFKFAMELPLESTILGAAIISVVVLIFVIINIYLLSIQKAVYKTIIQNKIDLINMKSKD